MAVEFIGAIDVPAETLDINNATISLSSLNMQPDDYIIFFSAADTTPMAFPSVFDNNTNPDAQVIVFASNGVAGRAAAVRASEILPSQTLTLGGSTAGVVSILSFRGVDPSFFQSSALALTNSGASGTPQAASFSTSADDTFAIRFIYGDDDAVIFDTPSGWSLSSRGNRTSGAQIVSYAINHRLVPTSTTIASNTYSATPTFNDQWMVFTLLLPSAAETATNVTINETPATASTLSVLPTVSGSANEIVAPATASALQTEPTIAVTANDHTEITTSIPVSALMAPATVSAQRFVNVIVDEPATALAEIGDNVIAGSSTFINFSAQEFLASAELFDPFVARSPMAASAQSGNHTVYVDPNYFNSVMQLNPYVYVNNGGGASSIVNHGSQTGTFTRGSDLLPNQLPGAPLSLVREGRAWKAQSFFNSQAFMNFTTATAAQNPQQLIGNGNFAYEFWVKEDGTGNVFIWSDGLRIYKTGSGGFPNVTVIRVQLKNSSSTSVNLDFAYSSSGMSVNNWNHVVLNVYQSGTNSAQRLVQLWINGSVRINQNISFTPWTNTNTTSELFGMDGQGLELTSGSFYDEVAWYDNELTNSQIVEHYNLIHTLSPDHTEFAEVLAANAESGDHQFTVNSNAIPEIKEATASALLTTPTLIAGRSFTHNAVAMTASATSVVPGVSYGVTYSATPNIAYAESANAFALNTIYFDYVQANILPYRYVTFDGATSILDYGSDNDYSVQPTVLGGTVVNPDEGINGKSAKTAGTSYVTDGVILKESEYGDDWGTLGNRYHSSFWVQKAPEDNSTGLRVIWNLNGHLDNQHIILYQYQGKLTLSFNDGSSTYINQTTTANINLFDGERHFVVVYTDHQGSNDSTYLYVDSVLVMTVSLGAYRVETINGTSVVGPNDEANNHPRLGIGCLITPFGATNLPVVPTNTKLYVDEVVWAKTAINQTGVTALYNIMPDKNNTDYAADPMTASGLSVMPAVSTQVILSEGPATASALINNVTVIADRNIVVNAASATASAQMAQALRINNIIITSDIMVASAIFNDAGIRITIPGGPMLATANLVKPFGTHNGELKVLSPYMRYIRTEALNGIAIYSMKEIK
jgi:hypothetical protein